MFPLSVYADEWAGLRSAAFLVLTEDQVRKCAREAARYYRGFQALTVDPTNSAPTIDADVDVTPEEWYIIRPLFELYCEREAALMMEATRSLGVEMVGRDSAAVQADIPVAEQRLQLEAFAGEPFSVGVGDE